MSISSKLPPILTTQGTAALNTSAQPSVGAASIVAPAAPQTSTAGPVPSPQMALAQMVQQALPGQGSIAGLTTVLSTLLGKVDLPGPVIQAAQQVLAQSLDTGKLDGAAVQRAIMNSGLFQEAKLAAGLGQQARADLKTALLGLQRTLLSWLGTQPPVQPVPTLPPPIRGQVPRARVGQGAVPDVPDDPQEAGKVLLERTEAGLSRLRLHQNASLPEAGQGQEAQWSLDLPVIIAGQQNVLQLQIHRDAEDANTRPEDRGWQLRFAIHLGAPGEVGAQISLRGAATGVMVWAENAETAALLNENLVELRQDLAGAGLHPGSVLVRSGAPMTPSAPPSKHVLDQTR